MASWTCVRPMSVTPRALAQIGGHGLGDARSDPVVARLARGVAEGHHRDRRRCVGTRVGGRRDDGAGRDPARAAGVGIVEPAADGVQVDVELARRLIAERRILGQRLEHDRVEALRDRVVEPRERRRIAVEDAIGDVGRRLALERQPAGEHLVEHDAQREQVGPRVERAAPHLLRRHVGERAHHRPRLRLEQRPGRDRGRRRALVVLGQAEVEQLDAPAAVDHQVGALDVAVDDAVAVRLVERVGRLRGDRHRLGDRQRTARHPRRERFAGDQLHDDERPVAVLAQVVDRGDVRRAQHRRGTRLAEQAGTLVRTGRARVQHLHRHGASEPRILGAIDLAHAAGPEPIAEAVLRELLAGERGRREVVHAPSKPCPRARRNSSRVLRTALRRMNCPSRRLSIRRASARIFR